MALNAAEARVAITGELKVAPFGTALPTDLAATAAAFVGVGYLDDNGLQENWQDTVNRIIAWQNAQAIRSVRTETALTLEMVMIQTSGVVLELFHPGSAMTTPSAGLYSMDVVPAVTQKLALVFDVFDDDKHIRLAAGNAELTARGAVPYMNGDVLKYPVTLECYPDSNGMIVRKLSDDAAWAVA